MTKKTTKTLPPRMAMPKKIRNLSKFIQFFSTSLATKFAYKLFVTPIKFRVPEREQMMRKSIQKKRVYINSLGKEIDVFTYGYSPKRVLLVHGWSGRGTQFFMLADKLLEKGYMIIGFDAPAHSNSEGKTTSLIEFVEVVKQLNVDFKGFTSAIGHSLGGVTLYNTAKILNLKNFVTIGSANKISEIISDFINNIGMKPKIGKHLKSFMEKVINEDDLEKFSVSKNAEGIENPVLIVHDTEDLDVKVHCAYDIEKELKNGQTLITSGLGHTKILRDNDVANKIVEFITENS